MWLGLPRPWLISTFLAHHIWQGERKQKWNACVVHLRQLCRRYSWAKNKLSAECLHTDADTWRETHRGRYTERHTFGSVAWNDVARTGGAPPYHMDLCPHRYVYASVIHTNRRVAKLLQCDIFAHVKKRGKKTYLATWKLGTKVLFNDFKQLNRKLFFFSPCMVEELLVLKICVKLFIIWMELLQLNRGKKKKTFWPS